MKLMMNLDAAGRPGGSGTGIRSVGRPELIPYFKAIAKDMKLTYNMVVEDEKQILTLIQTSLEKAQHTILSAESGREGLDLSRLYGGRIDILITDAILPHLNGFELAETILSERPNIKIIMISGFTEEILEEYGISISNFHFLQKPFPVRDLHTLINQAYQ